VRDDGWHFGTRAFVALSIGWAISWPFGLRGPFDDGALPPFALAFGGIVGALILRYVQDPAAAPGLRKALAMIVVSSCWAVAGCETMVLFPIICALAMTLQLAAAREPDSDGYR
jgi:hypothetical protein